MRPGHALALACLASLAAAACAPTGAFVWAEAYRAGQPGTGEYLLGPGDLVAVRVYNQEAMSARVRVRADGRVSLPFAGEVAAAGLSPLELSRQVQARLKEFVVNPLVTVAVEEARPLEVYLVGEVVRPGRYPLDPGASVLHALASAGGPTPFAARDRIFVLRREPQPVRIRFTMGALTRGEGAAEAFRLRAGDTIVVE